MAEDVIIIVIAIVIDIDIVIVQELTYLAEEEWDGDLSIISNFDALKRRWLKI
jgi:hypothetical protein